MTTLLEWSHLNHRRSMGVDSAFQEAARLSIAFIIK